MSERMPIRKRGPKLTVAWFLRLIGPKPKVWNTVERYGLPPQEFQKILHERAAYVNAKFLTDVKVRTQCEGNELCFRVFGDFV